MAVGGQELRAGEALVIASLSQAPVELLHVGLRAGGEAPPDLVAMLVGPSGKVRSDDDLVFYNNAVSADGAVVYAGSHEGTDWIRIRPDSLDADVARVVLGCAGGPLDKPGAVPMSLHVLDGAQHELASAHFTGEAGHYAMILFEFYRRDSQWRCRLLAQGYAGGLAALVTDFGVSVEPEPVPEPSPPAPPRQTAVTPAAAAPSQVGTTTRPPTAPAMTPAFHSPRHGGLFTSRKRAQLEAQNAELSRLLVTSGAMDNATIEAERVRLAGEVAALAAQAQARRADLAGLERRLYDLRAGIRSAEDDVELNDVGIYRYRHRLDDAVAYKSAISALRDRIRASAKRGDAVSGTTNWTVNGSTVQGRKMVSEVSKLMLRAYNADADHQARTMRAYKLDTALTRLDTTRGTIVRLGTTMNIQVSGSYHLLRREELELTADYLSKVEEEKERQRQLREDQREQQRAEAEYVREQERLERDRHRYSEALSQLEARGETQKAIEVRSQLTSVTAALSGLAQRRANLRLGHVYVISNIGAFGKRMMKIGMTRRLDPLDRVRELGDASVPFRFDVHALIFSEDAVALETALHHHFAAQRVNQVNARREFFYVTPGEVRDAIAALNSQYLISYNEEVDAPEWRQSGGPERALLPT